MAEYPFRSRACAGFVPGSDGGAFETLSANGRTYLVVLFAIVAFSALSAAAGLLVPQRCIV